MGLNCTFMELKGRFAIPYIEHETGLNCTFMELKEFDGLPAEMDIVES